MAIRIRFAAMFICSAGLKYTLIVGVGSLAVSVELKTGCGAHDIIKNIRLSARIYTARIYAG
uniref:hypothetical protein n=1 Tax=Dissulfurimicrobium sp. TaxID=2022436 RepID=UPI00404B1203